MRDAAARVILHTADVTRAWRVPGDEEAWLVDDDPRWPAPFVIVTDGSRRCGIVLPERDSMTIHPMPDRKGVGHVLRFCEGDGLATAFPAYRGEPPMETVDHDGRRWKTASVRAEAAAIVLGDIREARRPSTASFVDDEVEWMLLGDTIGPAFSASDRDAMRSLAFLGDLVCRWDMSLRLYRGKRVLASTTVREVAEAFRAIADRHLSEDAVFETLRYFGLVADGVVEVDGGALGRLSWTARFVRDEARLVSATPR